MREVIQKWYDWLKQACPEPAEVATSPEKKELAHVYSDGRQLWATDGYSLHARQVATEKQGHVTLDEDGLFQVSANGRLPDFAASLPQSQPAATVVVERDKLLQALAENDEASGRELLSSLVPSGADPDAFINEGAAMLRQLRERDVILGTQRIPS